MFALRTGRTLFSLTRAFSSVARSVEVIGVPFSGGQPKEGVDLAPTFLKELGLLDRLRQLGLNVFQDTTIDLGYLDSEEDSTEEVYIHNKLVKSPVTCGNVSKQTAEAVFKSLKSGRTPVVIGGDHSIATGTVFGSHLFNRNTCLLWVDAHADINSPLITKSGNIHGMPVSWLITGFPHFPMVPGYEWVHRCISPEQIAYVGLRDVEPQERALLKQLGIAAFYIEDIDELGIVSTMQKALEIINPQNDCPIHVSYDIDAMDPAIAPTTGTTVRGGLTISEGLYIAETVFKTGNLQSLDLVEINPRLGDGIEALKTAQTGIAIIEAMLGKPQNIPKEDLVPHNKTLTMGSGTS